MKSQQKDSVFVTQTATLYTILLKVGFEIVAHFDGIIEGY